MVHDQSRLVETNKIMKIALTGASGLIGSRIIELLRDEFDFISLPSEVLDITNKDIVHSVLNKTAFDFFIHLAAYTNVDKAEIEKEKASSLNIQGTRFITDELVFQKKPFIYVSTDFVFDGINPPFDEYSKPNPISYYGQTKYEAEKIVKDYGMIVRTSYPYRRYFLRKNDFMRSIKKLLEKGTPVQMVINSLITPTFIDDFIYGLRYLINHHSNEVFHLVGGDSLSPMDSAILIAKIFHLDSKLILAITYEDYFHNKAKRPKYSQIISKKNDFYRMKTFEEVIPTF